VSIYKAAVEELSLSVKATAPMSTQQLQATGWCKKNQAFGYRESKPCHYTRD